MVDRRRILALCAIAVLAGACGDSDPPVSSPPDRPGAANPFNQMFKSLEPQNADTVTDTELQRILSKYTTPNSNSVLNQLDYHRVTPLALPPYSTAAQATCDELRSQIGPAGEQAAAFVLDEIVEALSRHRLHLGFGADLLVGAALSACPHWIGPVTRAVTR